VRFEKTRRPFFAINNSVTRFEVKDISNFNSKAKQGKCVYRAIIYVTRNIFFYLISAMATILFTELLLLDDQLIM
jgi:hypothetical protein